MHELTLERKRENNNKWTKLDNYFKDYCEHSSIIGFNYVAEKRSKGERILWIILIVIALTLSMYFIMEQYNKYVESPFIVSLATRETPIFEIPFPAVTICPFMKTNRSMFNFTNIIHRLWDNENISDYETESSQYLAMVCDDDNMDEMEEDIPEKFRFNETFYERLYEIEPTKDLLESFTCRYMGKEYECEDVFTPILLDAGICYTFNMLNREEIFRPNVRHFSNFLTDQPKSDWTNENGYRAGSGKDAYPRRALQAGADNSFQIRLVAFDKDIDYLCSTDVGYSIILHSPNTLPPTKRDFVTLPLGSTTQVIVTPNVMTTSATVKGYQTEERRCYFKDERHLKYFETYTQGNCFLECLTNYTLEMCSCVSFYMPHENGTALCGNTWRVCLQEAENELKKHELNAGMGLDTNYQSCSCLPLCTQINYQTTTTTNTWEWKEYFKAHKKTKMLYELTDDDLNKIHYTLLKIYFKDEQFISYEKSELYGAFDFISNFGGLLGLFTGFSLLTVAEIIYYISVRIWCNKRLYNDIAGPTESI